MGIINVNYDSFYAGSRFQSLDEALEVAGRMLAEGADILDIGGMSTRPDAPEISISEELGRVEEVIAAISSSFPEAIISIDTYRMEVARGAIEAGASMINDISAGRLDPNLPLLAAEYGVPYIMMHMRGTPMNMKHLTQYDDLILEMVDYFLHLTARYKSLGVQDMVIDPGFGFSKNLIQNYELLDKLEVFSLLGYPLLAGVSRKGMFWRLLNSSPGEVLPATCAAHMAALERGANILRVHDVAPAKQVIAVYEQLDNRKGEDNC